MKRFLSILAVIFMLLSLLSACKGKGGKGSPEASGDSPVSESESAGEESGDIQGEESEAESGEQSGNGTANSTGNNSKSTGNSSKGTGTNSNSNTAKVYKTNDLALKSGTPTVTNNCNSFNYPIAKDQVTLNIMIRDYTGLQNYSAMKINQHIKEKMNININWTMVTLNDVISRLTLAYTSGNMPDVFLGMIPYGENFTYAKQGLIKPLDGYIDTYAPNIKKMFSDNPLSKYNSIYEDGKIYSFPMVNEERNPFIYESLFINKTWLKNLGLSMPKTTTEFKSVLKSFKNNDPNGNGLKDEIPLLLTNHHMAFALPACLYGPFGLAVYGGNVGGQINNDGKYQINSTSDDYKKALTYYRDLYLDGLIDPDWFINAQDKVGSKLTSSTINVGAFVSEDGTELIGAERMNDHYETVPPLKGPDGKSTWSVTQVEYVWSDWFVVSSKCKYPEIAVRFADYFYSLEGSLTAMYGPQGYNWNADSNGVISMTEDYYQEKHKTSDLTPGYPMPHNLSKDILALTAIPESKMSFKAKVKKKEQDDRIKYYLPVAPKYPELNYTNKITLADQKKFEEDEYLNTFIQTNRLDFLKEKGNIENFWNNYVASCNTLGATEMQKVYQKAANDYFNFLKNNK